MISLRGERWMLLALRGRFALDGRTLTELELQSGQEIAFAPEIQVRVLSAELPSEVLGVVVGDSPRVALQSTTSVFADGTLVPGWREGAEGWLWSAEDGLRWRSRGGGTQRLAAGDVFEAGAIRGEVVAVPLSELGSGDTLMEGSLQAPLQIVAQFHTVHLHPEGRETVLLEGVPGRIVSELVACGGPVQWQVLAGQIWREEASVDVLRQRWDASLQRLRSRLRAGGIRADLVRSDRTGYVELVLAPGDRVVDRT